MNLTDYKINIKIQRAKNKQEDIEEGKGVLDIKAHYRAIVIKTRDLNAELDKQATGQKKN